MGCCWAIGGNVVVVGGFKGFVIRCGTILHCEFVRIRLRNCCELVTLGCLQGSVGIF